MVRYCFDISKRCALLNGNNVYHSERAFSILLSRMAFAINQEKNNTFKSVFQKLTCLR